MIKIGNKVAFGFNAVQSGMKSSSVNNTPQLIANSTKGKFSITAPVSKAMGVAVGENVMFINNIAMIEQAIVAGNADLVAWANENGVDINNIALVIESGDVIDDIITEAKKVRSKSLVPATRLKNISDLSKKAKSIGIKVVKRKSKRKSKKRRHLSIGKISIN